MATRGPILECRDQLVAILDAAAIPVLETVSGRFVTPCAILEPGDPFVGPAGLGGSWRRVRWRVVLVAGAGDASTNIELMTQLVQLVVLAIGSAPGWTTPTVSGPRLVRVVGVEGGYTAAELVAETIADITEV